MDSSYGASMAGVSYQPNKAQKRKRVETAVAPARRSTNAYAYFLWIIYAIGAQFSTGSEQLSLGYYTHSLRYLGNVLAQQNLDTVQALLTLMQYQFRAPSGPSIWHLLGVTLRLCIELGYHRKTRLSGPHALAPTYEDVMEFLSELDIWRQQTPPQNLLPSTLPHQSDENVQATYFQAALLLIRPLLFRTAIDQSLLYRCVTLSADACENARELSLNPQTFNSPITVYNCFRCGVTLLQCLAVQPTILPLRRTLRAISAVSSALAVYCRVVATAEPLLRLFDMLSDQFLGDNDHPAVWNPNLSNLRSILQRIISAGPSETLELYKILTEEEGDSAHTPISQAAVDENESGNHEFDFLLGTDSMSTLGMNLMMPFETYPAFTQDPVPSQDAASLWNTIP
ncbi:hypothetical protein V2A60_002864 [Cordyceps javanica]|uniref:Fungal specific transcription factordomain-containing protein n=1 Tax=Cordyceps javanica TaxID=43265 RepID=A0A545UX88_9HYPO|nr:fungal specific transcription factordomain-containing protein [Cordyceps javanica]TQW05940.1 fungal specific transcription factor domain-containing protein [Cordyceps javanica]